MSNSILDHWRVPFNRGKRSDADLQGHAISRVCGDEIRLYFFIEDGIVQNVYFDGEGCVICLGMASLTAEFLVGKTVTDACLLTERDILQLVADVEIDKRRHGCALVAFNALQDAFLEPIE